mgnify:CR=1 FL=1
MGAHGGRGFAMTDKKTPAGDEPAGTATQNPEQQDTPSVHQSGTSGKLADLPLDDIMAEGDLSGPGQTPSGPGPSSTPPVWFNPLSLSDLLRLPPKQWLLDMVFGAGDLVMLYGPPGTGKTFVAIDMIFSLCLAQQWGERFAVPSPLTVAYCAGEGVGGLPQRFQAAAEFYGVDELPGFSFFATTPQLHTKASTPETILQFVTDWQTRGGGPLDLLVIDTFHSATIGAEENSATDAGVILASLKMAQRALGCAVMLLHHTNKNGNAERGSSALRGAMDCMIGIAEAGHKFVMNCEKLKDGAAWQSQTFALVTKAESVRVWWDQPVPPGESNKKEDGYKEQIIELLTENGGQRLRASAITEALGLGKSHVLGLLAEMTTAAIPSIQREIENPSKAHSIHNPWVYFVGQTADEKDESLVTSPFS